MKIRLTLAMVAVLLLGAAGLDFAGKDSHIARWLRQIAPAAVSPAEAPSTAAEPTPAASAQYAQWLAEAKAIWADAMKRDPKTLELQAESFYREANPDKQFAMLKSMGITVTRAAFDQALADHRESKPPQNVLIRHVINQWLRESPREALAWLANSVALSLRRMDSELGKIIEDLHHRPDYWAAFAEASPIPDLAARLQVWAKEFDDPGSILAMKGVVTIGIEDYMAGLVETGSREKALTALLRCTQGALKDYAIKALTYRLSPTQLLQLANGEFANDQPLSNMLRALAGDSEASFEDAVRCLTSSVLKPLWQFRQSQAKSLERLYTLWLDRDPSAALAHAVSDNTRFVVDSFMNAAVQSGQLNDEVLFDSLNQVSGEQRDAALTAFYRAQAAGDPEGALQRIIQSTLIEDEGGCRQNHPRRMG
jgi:hypothetical protein